MSSLPVSFSPRQLASGQYTLDWQSRGESVLTLSCPFLLESGLGPRPASVDGERKDILYDAVTCIPYGMRASASFTDAIGVKGSAVDTWTKTAPTTFTVHRSIEIRSAPVNAGLRAGLHLQPAFVEGLGFNDLQYFAPNACYDLDDLNEDGVEDYLDAQHLSYRDDRLNALTVMAYHPKRQVAFSVSRADIPKYDDVPVRETGQQSFLQNTDIGALGFQPNGGALHDALLTAYYPFVERERCHALLVAERTPWGAFRPVFSGDRFSVSYTVRIYEAPSPHDALWIMMKAQMAALEPKPVHLEQSIEEIGKARLDALSRYFMEDSAGGAGYVTNCHPQDGKQLSNVIQYDLDFRSLSSGFTGQNVLNAANAIRVYPPGTPNYLKAVKVVDFYVRTAMKSPFGFTHGLYNMDAQKHDSWWTGLLLPIAYASPGDDLERLMGPLYAHHKSTIDALSGCHGIYIRCVCEETDSLLSVYEHLVASSSSAPPPPSWFEVVKRFGDFLLRAQEPDGSWRRAYSLDTGEPLTEPDFWFGQTFYQQRSSTAVMIPLLLRLASLMSNSDSAAAAAAAAAASAFRTAAVKAGRFVREHFVDKIKHNGGIHDSIYAKPQLVDHESILFCCRGLLQLYETVGGSYFLEGAVRAAQLSASWILLWDIPLPPSSTFARHHFRTTGWAGCDTPGAGYVHPMGLYAAPDLVSISLLTSDPTFLDIAELCLMGCNENVGTAWGYAMEGLQEEGILLSPWFVDDPMFAAHTGFGGRGKGEGNKTCLPWVSAVTVWAGLEMKRRFGTLEFDVLRGKILWGEKAEAEAVNGCLDTSTDVKDRGRYCTHSVLNLKAE